MDPSTQGAGAGITAVVLGVGAGAAELTRRAGRPIRAVSGVVLRGTGAAARGLTPDPLTSAVAARARTVHAGLERLARAVLEPIVRQAVEVFLETTDLTALVRQHVDIDALAAELDVDAVVARVDLDAAVARVDLDAVVARVDLDAAVARVDVERVVRRVDLDAVAATLDLDRLVASVDLDAAVKRVDLDTLVARVDPDQVVAKVDVDAVLARIDLVGLAREVIDAIDLPEIVRHSTGALTSDTVRTVRTDAMQADDVVAGIVDRLLRRARPRSPLVP